MNVNFSKRAERDYVERMADLLEYGGEDLTRSFEQMIEDAIEHLRRFPQSGGLVMLKVRKTPVRRWVVDPMLIFYEATGDTLSIIRIRHGARKPVTRHP